MEELKNNKYCVVPFTDITVHLYEFKGPGLGLVPCCSAWVKEPLNLAKIPVFEDNKDNSFINFIQSWNDSRLVELRRSIIDGTYKYCKKDTCPYYYSDALPCPDEEIKTYIRDKKVVLDYLPKTIKICIDNTCNLQCPSCRKEKIYNSSDLTYKRTKAFMSMSKRIFINGSGEVFANKQMLKALREYTYKEFPNIEGFLFITNGTLLNKTMWYSLPEDLRERVLDINISIDSFNSETYKKIRVSGNFDILYKNLLFISDLRKNNELKHITASCVLQNKNIKEISDFIKNVIDLKFDTVIINKIENWGWEDIIFSKINLPYNWSNIYKKEIDEAICRVKDSNIEFISNILRI